MKKKNTGFTLIEMIIVLFLTVIILGIGCSIFITGNKVFADSDVKTTLQMEAKDIQENISNICMEANSSPIINDDKVTFIDENEQKIIIYHNSNELSISVQDKEDNVVTTKTLSTNIKSFNFKYNNNNKLFNVNLELGKDKGFSRNNSYLIDFKVTSRNM